MTTAPLLRDHMKPREKDHYWEKAFFRLANGYSVLIEVGVRVSVGKWYISLNKAPIHNDYAVLTCDSEHRIDHNDMDEFEAQMVFDHYVQTYGLLEQVTP